MQKRGNATAVILVVALLILGVGVIMYEPYIINDKDIDYTKHISSAKQYLERQNSDFISSILKKGMLPRINNKTNFWYCNEPLPQNINYALTGFKEDYVINKTIVQEVLINITSPVPKIDNRFRFTIENISVNFTSKNENRTLIFNNSYSRPDLLYLFEDLNEWMRCDLGNMRGSLKTAMTSTECGFFSCKCEDNTPYEEIRAQLTEEHGFNRTELYEVLNASVEKLNWITAGGSCYEDPEIQSNFMCRIDYNHPAAELDLENYVTNDYVNNYPCSEQYFNEINSFRSTYRFQAWEEDRITKNFVCQASSPSNTEELLKRDPPMERNKPGSISKPFGVFFYLDKRTAFKVPVICESQTDKATFWIYASVEAKCLEEPRAPDPDPAYCGGGPSENCPENSPCGMYDCNIVRCDANGGCTRITNDPAVGTECGSDECYKKTCQADGSCEIATIYEGVVCDEDNMGCLLKHCDSQGQCSSEYEPAPNGESCPGDLRRTCVEYICQSGECIEDQEYPEGDICKIFGECNQGRCNGEGTCAPAENKDRLCTGEAGCDGTCEGSGSGSHCVYDFSKECTKIKCGTELTGTCTSKGECSVYTDDKKCCETGNKQWFCGIEQECCIYLQSGCANEECPAEDGG